MKLFVFFMTQIVNTKERCPRCGRGKLVTDTESGEMFCSKCGFVMSEKLQESGPEWRSFTQDECLVTKVGLSFKPVKLTKCLPKVSIYWLMDWISAVIKCHIFTRRFDF